MASQKIKFAETIADCEGTVISTLETSLPASWIHLWNLWSL